MPTNSITPPAQFLRAAALPAAPASGLRRVMRIDLPPRPERAAPIVRRGPILVTGSHRSGTTWVGKMLATAPRTCYLHEPFKPGWPAPYVWSRFDTWFTHLPTGSTSAHESGLERTLALHFQWRRHYICRPSLRMAAEATCQWGRWTLNRLRHFRPVMKDPIALFSAPWLAERFDMSVVVMIRHPAAFVSSIKLKKWWFDFNHWLRQDRLMRDWLAPFECEIRALADRNDDLVEQAILQWRVFHHVIRRYQVEHPDWLFVRHEDLSLDPVGGFARLHAALGLNFTGKCRAAVLASSARENLTDASAAGKSTLFVHLNSAANLRNWQRRLSSAEIARVREGTADVAGHFYRDSDWD